MSVAVRRPGGIDELGAGGAIRALADRCAGRDLSVDVAVERVDEHPAEGDRRLAELHTAIYPIVQEALTNA